MSQKLYGYQNQLFLKLKSKYFGILMFRCEPQSLNSETFNQKKNFKTRPEFLNTGGEFEFNGLGLTVKLIKL